MSSLENGVKIEMTGGKAVGKVEFRNLGSETEKVH